MNDAISAISGFESEKPMLVETISTGNDRSGGNELRLLVSVELVRQSVGFAYAFDYELEIESSSARRIRVPIRDVHAKVEECLLRGESPLKRLFVERSDVREAIADDSPEIHAVLEAEVLRGAATALSGTRDRRRKGRI